MELNGAKAVVTGGAKGLGLAITQRLAAAGVLVTIWDIDEAAMEQARAQIPGVTAYRCDITSYDEVSALAQRHCEEQGVPAIIVNNAGILFSMPLCKLSMAGVEGHDVAAWRRVLSTDLDSVFHVTVSFVQRMIRSRTKGVIVNISSISAQGNAGQSAYAAAKAGVNALTMTWAKELGPYGIRSVAIAPGFFGTDSTKAAVNQSVLDDITKRVPLKRLGNPEEIADTLEWVVRNDYVNGRVIPVDGGLVI